MIELEPEIMKLAEEAETYASLKAILEENNVDISESDLRELAGMLEIPHGYNCPCCMGMFYSIRFQQEFKTRKINL